MVQEDEKYSTISGLKDGSKVETAWTTAESKNAGKSNGTSNIEQAAAEIDYRYKKQLKSGYFRDIKDVETITYVEPMLAQTLHKLTAKHQPDYAKQSWGIQCKFNGNRCIATKDGLFTRTGERYMSVPHIENSLKPFFVKYPEAVLDGELFNNDLRQKLNEINKLIRKTKHIDANDIATSEKLVEYYVYDGYGFNCGYSTILEESSAYSERKMWIDNNIVRQFRYIRAVETTLVKSEAEMQSIFQKLLNDQQEGAILRNMDSGYEHKRSKNLVKVKIDEDDEAIILNITDGDGNWSGAATNVTLKWKDKTFDGVFKGTYETRAEILKNKKDWVGREVTFLFMGLTGLGTPSFARVDPANCFKIDK